MIYFLSGLPRSGSTLLGSLLNQNPDVYVSPTSPLLDLLCLQNEAINKVKQQYTFDVGQQSGAIYDSLPLAFYRHIREPHIIDKHRAWPRNIHPARMHVSTNPKIICTYRPIPDIITSFLKLIEKDPNNFIDKNLIQKQSPRNTKTRAAELWNGYISDPWQSVQIGLKKHASNIHLVSYDDIVTRPEATLKNIYSFLEIPEYAGHSFSEIANTCAESKDSAWGLKDLHTLRPDLKKTSNDPIQVLGKEMCAHYSQYNIL